MKFLHTMVRVSDLEKSLWFYCTALGLHESRRKEVKEGRFTLVYLMGEESKSEIELTYNWDDSETLDAGRSFGHLAFGVKDIYKTCSRLQTLGVIINRPPRDGRMAFIKSPDGISIELLQEGAALEVKLPWSSMCNNGIW